ncbi:uncharacterized protein LOC111622704 [Centruroides sculpturatus]|uniref:uncharacterized protein LOC111622704 n=1 Tax=Centruroides sculpturatus TaxID=218467 RepID=UPI000C6E8D20|nr:uncharacterized protein LOC111622704 [Centruroides sculpturatus]
MTFKIVWFVALMIIYIGKLSECQRRNPGANCLKTKLSSNVVKMFDVCVLKAKNECTGSSNQSKGEEPCSIPKSWKKLCPCMIEEIQKIFGSCCKTYKGCDYTIEGEAMACIFNMSTKLFSSFHDCCDQLNSFWYRRLNKVLYLALKDFLQRKYGENSGIQSSSSSSSKTIQSEAAQEICTDLNDSEYTDANIQTTNCTISENILQASQCTFHDLIDHLEDNCDNKDDKSSESDNSDEMSDKCDPLSDMVFTRWSDNITVTCEVFEQFKNIVHMSLKNYDMQNKEKSQTTTLKNQILTVECYPMGKKGNCLVPHPTSSGS